MITLQLEDKVKNKIAYFSLHLVLSFFLKVSPLLLTQRRERGICDWDVLPMSEVSLLQVSDAGLQTPWFRSRSPGRPVRPLTDPSLHTSAGLTVRTAHGHGSYWGERWTRRTLAASCVSAQPKPGSTELPPLTISSQGVSLRKTTFCQMEMRHKCQK